MHGEQRTSEKKQRLKDLAEDLRADIRNAKDPCLKATYETSAEVLMGIGKGHGRFREKERSRVARLTALRNAGDRLTAAID